MCTVPAPCALRRRALLVGRIACSQRGAQWCACVRLIPSLSRRTVSACVLCVRVALPPVRRRGADVEWLVAAPLCADIDRSPWPHYSNSRSALESNSSQRWQQQARSDKGTQRRGAQSPDEPSDTPAAALCVCVQWLCAPVRRNFHVSSVVRSVTQRTPRMQCVIDRCDPQRRSSSVVHWPCLLCAQCRPRTDRATVPAAQVGGFVSRKRTSLREYQPAQGSAKGAAVSTAQHRGMNSRRRHSDFE